MADHERQTFLLSRAHLPANDAAIFMENRVLSSETTSPVILEDLDQFVPLQVAQEQQQISVELWQQANDEKDKLFALMEQVQVKLDKREKDASKTSIVDSRPNLQKSDWSQVMDEIEKIKTRWSATPRRLSKMMQCLDKIGRGSGAFKEWLQLLPAGDYGSSVCGAFSLAIGAVGQYVKVEDAVLEALVNIPETLNDARRYVEIYAEQRNTLLERKTFDLYLEILRSLAHIMRFFADSSVRKASQAVFKQSNYKADLTKSLAEIKKQTSRIKEEANQCFQMRLMNINQSLAIAHQSQNCIVKNQDLMLEKQNNLSTAVNSIYKMFLSSLPQNLSTEFGEARRLEFMAIPDRARKATERSSGEKDTKMADRLLELLQFDADNAAKDTETALRLSYGANDQARSKAAGVIRHAAFKAYMTSETTPMPLLINGNEDLANVEGLSPLTVVSAKLVSVAQQSGHSFVLRYFCDLHRPYGGDPQTSSPTGMMASLLGQLLVQMHSRGTVIDLAFLSDEQWAKVARRKLSVLCRIFQQLVAQLPGASLVFCILDEVSLYETGLLRKDMDTVMQKLVRITKHADDICFKFLVTCQGQASLSISRYFAGHVLELQETVEEDDAADWMLASMAL